MEVPELFQLLRYIDITDFTLSIETVSFSFYYNITLFKQIYLMVCSVIFLL